MSKKGQFKIQEMSFMLLALVLFFVIAVLFFVIVTNAGIIGSHAQLSKNKAITTISKIAGSPEMSYGEQMSVDSDKLIVIKENSAFRNFWDIDGGLIVKRVYPYSDKDVECILGNYQICNTFTLKKPDSGYNEISSFVALCRKETRNDYSYDKCELGIVSAYIEKES